MRAYDVDKLLDILDVMIVGHKSASDVYDVVDSMPTIDAESLIAKHEDIGYEKGFRDGYAEALEKTDNVPDKNVGKRLIDAEEAYKVLTDYYHHKTEIQHDALKEAIERVPTVDAVEVVQCKDCKFHLNSNEKCGLVDTRLHFYETDKVWTEDCFCAWGERKEDGKTD